MDISHFTLFSGRSLCGPAAVFTLVRLLSALIPTEEEGEGKKEKLQVFRQTAEKAQPCSPEQCAELAAYI